MNDFSNPNSLAGHDWIYFCSKPFSLFAISLWDHCYAEYIGLITQGIPILRDSVFIQGKNGIVRNYRKKKDLEGIKQILLDLYKNDRTFIVQKLKDASAVNMEGQRMLDEKIESPEASVISAELQKVMDLACRITTLGSVLPRFLSQALVDAQIFDNEILDQCIELKKVSLYPRILAECIEPFIMDKNQTKIDGKHFVYIANNSMVDIVWTEEPDAYIRAIESDAGISKTTLSGAQILKGQPIFPGNAIGVARVCLSMHGDDVKEFNLGDILVTTDSNPNLRHLIEKAGGLIVEEGDISGPHDNDDSGMIAFEKNPNIASHASVLSSEYGTPCVMNVKNATSRIKVGDKISIDGSAGIIEIMN